MAGTLMWFTRSTTAVVYINTSHSNLDQSLLLPSFGVIPPPCTKVGRGSSGLEESVSRSWTDCGRKKTDKWPCADCHLVHQTSGCRLAMCRPSPESHPPKWAHPEENAASATEFRSHRCHNTYDEAHVHLHLILEHLDGLDRALVPISAVSVNEGSPDTCENLSA